MSDKPCEETSRCSPSCIYYDFECGCTIRRDLEEPNKAIEALSVWLEEDIDD